MKSAKKEMRRPAYRMERIQLADCKPHADAEAYSASSEDRAALANSIGEAGVLSPIAVVPAEGNGEQGTGNGEQGTGNGWYVIDGIGRMNALIAAGETETDAQVFDLGDLTVAEFVISKNSMMRKVTTGTRVMAYLKCHEREVLAAADPEKYQKRKDSKWRNGHKEAAQSYDRAASEKGWNARDIAERLGVSDKDVLAGIELLKASVECCQCENVANANSNSQLGTGNTGIGNIGNTGNISQMDLFETMDAVLRGETPIRRWKAAACGKVSKTGGKAAADYTEIGARLMKSLIGVWENWQTVRMARRESILADFRRALAVLPDDFRAVIEAEFGGATGPSRPAKAKRR